MSLDKSIHRQGEIKSIERQAKRVDPGGHGMELGSSTNWNTTKAADRWSSDAKAVCMMLER